MEMNFFTTLRATRAALGAMVEQGSGSIVNVASVNAFFQPDGGTIDYGAAKAARRQPQPNRSRRSSGRKGIRVNCVSPGPVSTDLWLGEHGVAETVAKATGDRRRHDSRAPSPASAGSPPAVSRTPEEVATLVMMLASDRIANVTGANYVIDGGLVKTT